MKSDSNSASAITTPEGCATTTTWVHQTSVSGDYCATLDCAGVSQPLFGIAEDWAWGHQTTLKPDFYVVGAIEWSGTPDAADTSAVIDANFGTGNY